MKKVSLLAAGLVFVSASVFAEGNNNHAAASASNDTVKRVVVEFKGKPPYKRTVETLDVTDIAALEASSNVDGRNGKQFTR